MSEKFKGKYRMESARLQLWNYGWNAAYFVTICTQNRECFFGDVLDGDMVLNDIGKIANDCWLEIPNHFSYVKLGNHVIMPNHVHGIVVIDKRDNLHNDERNDGHNVETPKLGVSTTTPNRIIMPNHVHGIVVIDKPDNLHNDERNDRRNVETPKLGVSTTNRTNAASEKWNPGTLGVIINQYKRAVTIHSRKIKPDFAWQSRFHDHIIRNDESFQKISEYIINNPLNWSVDQLYM